MPCIFHFHFLSFSHTYIHTYTHALALSLPLYLSGYLSLSLSSCFVVLVSIEAGGKDKNVILTATRTWLLEKRYIMITKGIIVSVAKKTLSLYPSYKDTDISPAP